MYKTLSNLTNEVFKNFKQQVLTKYKISIIIQENKPTMKNFKKLLLLGLLFVLTLSSARAQNYEVELKGVPNTVYWNLHPTEKEELQVRNYQYAVSLEDTAIWSDGHNGEKFEPVGLTPEAFGIAPGSFDYSRFINLVLKSGKYDLVPAWGVPQLYLVTGYTGPALWIPTKETVHGGEIPRIGSSISNSYTRSLREVEFFPDDPRRSGVRDIWLFTKAKK